MSPRSAPSARWRSRSAPTASVRCGTWSRLIETFHLTNILFVLVVLGSIARLAGFSIIRFMAYIKDELLIVLGTSWSETVLPQMIQKMEHLGASCPVAVSTQNDAVWTH